MRRLRWRILFAAALMALSIFVYAVQIQVFKTPRDTFFYLFQDIAFVPIQVLLVTIIINEVLNIREKRSLLRKLNMVIGAFFSETGTMLLNSFPDFDLHFEQIRPNFLITNEWSAEDFAKVKRRLHNYDYNIDSRKGDLGTLKVFLSEKRDFLLGLLENPNLLEHRSFTDLLRAVFHLTEELTYRKDVSNLPKTDYEHLSVDIKRAYILLLVEWLSYMKYLKDYYPYLFSLAIRTNPLDPDASPEVQ
jgi:hypothetical protein